MALHTHTVFRFDVDLWITIIITFVNESGRGMDVGWHAEVEKMNLNGTQQSAFIFGDVWDFPEEMTHPPYEPELAYAQAVANRIEKLISNNEVKFSTNG